MKKILILIWMILLSSCTHIEWQLEDIKINENKVTAVSDEELQAVFWEFDDENIWEKEKEQKDITQKILWDENAKFTYCDSLSKYDKQDDYYKTDDIILLEKAIENITYSTDYNITYNFPKKIAEFCKTNDSKKYILWWITEYNTIILWKYDKDLDLFEVIEFKWNFSKYYMNKWWFITWRNYGDISLEKYYKEYIESKKDITWFWIKNKNIIPFANYWVTITWHAESAPWIFSDILQFFSQSTREYCEWWLTSEWKLSVCFVDIFYDVDLDKNEIKDSRVCSYYVDDNWEIKTLEKCFDFNEYYKWYNLKYKAKWMDIYQDETWDLSILDIDLDSAIVDFAWANTDYEKTGEWYYRRTLKTELEYENENSKLYRFNRFDANEFPNTFPREYYIKNNTLAVINWQFFDQTKTPTFLSFPLKSWWKVINSHIDNEIPKRTFIIDWDWNAKILEWYKKEYLENPNYKELIVWFTPDVEARKDDKIWRTYIWINNSKNVVFFVAKDKTQEEMNKIISDYGIKKENIIMMDWWPSSQFAYYDNKWPWSEREQFYGEWKVPHYFIIYAD